MLAIMPLLAAAAEAGHETVEAPNPILPEWNEVIWGSLGFLVLFVLLRQLAYPAIKKMLAEREDKIRGDLEAAEQAKSDAQGVLGTYQQQLADARNEAGRIIEEARKAADDLRRDLMAKAEQEAAALRVRSQGDIDQTVARAKADLQREVANFAVSLAEKVVERNLDREAQTALIDRYIADVGGMTPNGGSTN